MTAPRGPLVSVIVPAYNAERYIRDAVTSVLNQTYRNYDVIVVDDGSTDGTSAAVRAFDGAVRYIQQPNQGPAAARNAGLQAARGTLICFLDADDSWAPDKLATQVAFMRAHPTIGLMFTDEEEFDETGIRCVSLLSTSRFYPEIATGLPIAEAFQKLLEENFIPTSMVIARRECFETVGLFDAALRGPEDRDMWSRIAAHFPIAGVRQAKGRKRIVATSVSRDVERTLRSRILLWTKAHRLFPELAPVQTVNALLAPTYLQLGFLLFDKGRAREARQLALTTLGVSRSVRTWLLALSLVAFSYTGKPVAAFVFRCKRLMTGRVTNTPAKRDVIARPSA